MTFGHPTRHARGRKTWPTEYSSTHYTRLASDPTPDSTIPAYQGMDDHVAWTP